MAAVVFLRVKDTDSDTRITFVCSKTRVAPLKKLTIPRLELSAAVLLAKLTKYVQDHLELSNSPVCLWTDSSVSLAWIICKTLYSDGGTNFLGADQQLRKLFSSGSKEALDLANLLLNDGTEWKFNPPGAPHFGGKWEAAVKSVKFRLKRTIGDSLLTFE